MIALLPVWGAQIQINFNSISPGAFTSLTFIQDGVQVTIAHLGTPGYTVQAPSWGTLEPPTWGANPAPGAAWLFSGANLSNLLVTFSVPAGQVLTGANVNFGDWGNDADSPTIGWCTAANGTSCTNTTGSLPATTGFPWTPTLLTMGMPANPATTIASVVLGGSTVFMDNLTLTFDAAPPPPPDDGGDDGPPPDDGGGVPEPGTMAIMATGLIALAYFRRRR